MSIFPLFICVNPNETLACYYAALVHSVGGELPPPPTLPPPNTQLTSISIVNQLIALQKKRKRKEKKGTEIHRKKHLRTLQRSHVSPYSPLLILSSATVSGFAPLYCICSSALGCVIKGAGRDSLVLTFIADLLKTCFQCIKTPYAQWTRFQARWLELRAGGGNGLWLAVFTGGDTKLLKAEPFVLLNGSWEIMSIYLL